MKGIIGKLSEVRDEVSTLDDLYNKVATLRELRRGAFGVAQAADAIDASARVIHESAREVDDERAHLLAVAEDLLETVTALELADRQAHEDEKAELEEMFLEGIERALALLVEGVEAEIATRAEQDDEDVEEACGGAKRKRKRKMARYFEDECVGDDEELEDDKEEFEESVASDLTLDSFLEGVVHAIQQEGIEDHDDAVGLLSSTVSELVEEGLLSEIPDYDEGPEKATVWAARAMKLDLPGLVTHLARSVDSE